ncbi:vacuolar protein sorting-associated protein 8 [Dorcoceras hygrometricum]|uniref:Vacuolar protein sorting-associated protein 8 n=1 Tax=Dorcoceras hygrometricum TaxID=472368 RepID=A0A2Z7AWP7_9LAMI|nr:vacuolar protein sorting-associated protein 8 [Dorcoceras hygrometricum]
MEWWSAPYKGRQWKFLRKIFAGAFELPMDGLTDLSDVPKDLVFDVRIIFSDSGEQVSTSCKKREMKIEFRLLSDILEKSIFVKAGSFDAVTHERFLLMADIIGGVQINWGRYVVINEKVIMAEVADEPRVKRTPVKKAVSRKRPAVADVVKPVVSKKKRTKVGKADKGSVLITVSQEAVPLQIVEPTPAAPAEQPPVPKRKSKKRRLRLHKDTDDEIVKERGTVEEDVENIFEEQREATSAALVVEETIVGSLTEKASEPTMENELVVESTAEEVRTTSADDVDLIIEQVITETAQIEIDGEEQNADGIDVEGTTVSGTDIGEQTVPRDEETDQWFNHSYEFIAQEADRPVVTASDTDEEMETVDFGTGVREQQLQIFYENESIVDSSAVYIVTEPEAETVKDQGTDIPDVVPATADKVSNDESMTIDEILLTITAYCPLPSALGEITKIQLGKSISIPGVNEGDWYKASLPKIHVDAKGKAPLEIMDPVKGNPAKEQFSLICADIAVLVQLREKVIDEVEQFFNSFSFNKLAVLKIEDFYAKEEKVLTWAETDSTREALQRRMYILTKYRELLIRKFLEAHKSNFVPGEGSSATDLKVLDMLSNLHSFVLEELRILMQAHGFPWERTCCSKMFEGDSWKPLPRPIVCTEILHRISYVDILPPINEFFKVMKKRWADVCIEVAQFFVSGKLLPIGSLNFCRAIAVAKPTPVFGSRMPTVTYWGWYRLCTVFALYCLFGGLSTIDIHIFVSTIAEDRSVLRDLQLGTHSVSVSLHVQSVSSSVFVDQSVQLFLDQRPHSPSTSADSSMHFVEDDIHLGDDAASNQLSLPVVSADFSVSSDDLRASISQLITTQKKDTRTLDDYQNDVLSKLNKLEKDILAALHQHEEANRSMIQNVRQEARTQSDALSVKLNDFRKGVQGHSAFVTSDLADVRKEQKAQRAMLEGLDEQVATIQNDLLDFRVKADENHLNLSTQLGFLVDYINRGGDAKKGEGGSSRPQPPPDDQDRPSGGSAGRSSGGDGSQRRSDKGGSSKKRQRSSGGSGSNTGRITYGPYLPPKRDADYWITG